MTPFIHNPPVQIVRAASGPRGLMVELMSLRERMLRDLERFLSIQLSLPGSVSLRWGRKSGSGGRAMAGGLVGSE